MLLCLPFRHFSCEFRCLLFYSIISFCLSFSFGCLGEEQWPGPNFCEDRGILGNALGPCQYLFCRGLLGRFTMRDEE